MSSPLIVSSPILGDSTNVRGFARFGEFANLRGFAKLGPRIIARECDRLIIKVVNHVQYNATLY
ncbi:hypothetical protein Gorai_004528, partial [Gossypium raimondii]|nr:hypothetical protein [Gossypium raimondii]